MLSEHSQVALRQSVEVVSTAELPLNCYLPESLIQSVPVSDGYRDKPFLTSADGEAIYRSLITPEMLMRITPEGRQELKSIETMIRKSENADDPFEEPTLLERVISMLAFGEIPHEVIFNQCVNAAMNRSKFDYPVLRDFLESSLENHREKHGHLPPRAYLGHDDYGRMTRHVSGRIGRSLAVLDRKTFLVHGRRCPSSVIERAIHQILEQCTLLDWSREKSTPVNNRIVAEVHSALLRILPWQVEADIIIDECGHPATITRTAASFVSFAERCLELSVNDAVKSESVWDEWLHFCVQNAIPAGDRRDFFKQLLKWGGEHVKKTRPRSAGGRTPTYIGIRIRDRTGS